jgi:hypothetical protein
VVVPFEEEVLALGLLLLGRGRKRHLKWPSSNPSCAKL